MNIFIKKADHRLFLKPAVCLYIIMLAWGVLCINKVFGQGSGSPVVGRVTDSEGRGIPGVKIYVKEYAKSVVSERCGIYDLNLDGTDSTVVFSKIGYLIKELSIDNRKIINVTLENENSLFNETVDLGYYSVKRRDVNIAATYLN